MDWVSSRRGNQNRIVGPVAYRPGRCVSVTVSGRDMCTPFASPTEGVSCLTGANVYRRSPTNLLLTGCRTWATRRRPGEWWPGMRDILHVWYALHIQR